MRSFHPMIVLPAAAFIAACGGAAGGSGLVALPPGGSAWVAGQFSSPSAYAAMCAAPRTGTDPATLKAYTDRQGTALDEKNWLRSWSNDLYLWFNEIADRDPGTFASDAAYFTALKSTAITSSGRAKDQFHFTYASVAWQALSQSGVAPGYGATFAILAKAPPRNIVVAYTEPASPAASAPALLARGAKVLAVDGADLVNATDQASVDKLNAGLRPKSIGESHTFSILDAGATLARDVTLVSADITSVPVQNVKVLQTPLGAVGYLLFNDHIATAEAALVQAFTMLASAGVKDLVLDIRYNGGGYLDIASETAYMIAGPAQTRGQTFELTQFNSKHSAIDPVTLRTIAPTGFHSTTLGFGSLPPGQALPALNLPRVYLLTGPGTCSASESIINGLRGINVEVIQIGSSTCGKPYGFYPTDNCAVTYFSIQFQGVNAQNFGNYPDGFSPVNTRANVGATVPGCSVADDFAHALGDPAEGLLASALSYRANGICPTGPTGQQADRKFAQGYMPPATSATVIKSLWQRNRIYRLPENR